MDQPLYVKLSSPFGAFAVVWRDAGGGPMIQQVLLARDGASGEKRARGAFAGLRKGTDPRVEEVAARIQRFLEGEVLSFALDLVDFGRCSPFQRRIILAEHGIPRGMVSTYGRIARHLGSPGRRGRSATRSELIRFRSSSRATARSCRTGGSEDTRAGPQ
jgi:O6-methylguanine-DNA--protein-cysteine methyltransferase